MREQHRHVDTAVFGATFLGAAAAMTRAASRVVIERGYLIGSEFVDSLRHGASREIESRSEIGAEFRAVLSEKNIVNGQGDIYPAAAMFVLCDFMKKRGVNAMLATEVVSIEKRPGEYLIKIFNCDGYSFIHAGKIIDTTSEGVLHDGLRKTRAKKFLNALIDNRDSSAPPPESVQTSFNRITKKTTLHFEVEKDAGYIAARKSFYDFLAANQERLNGWKISLAANTFDYVMPETKTVIGENHIWQPSCGCASLLEAFDTGGCAL